MPEDRFFRTWIPILLSAFSYLLIAYNYPRHDSAWLFVMMSVLGLTYWWIMRSYQASDFKILIGAAMILRLLFVFAEPSLSDDVYRFIWDGRLLANGINPFDYLPGEALGKFEGLDLELFQQLNSKDYYTVYPPLSQLIFWVAAVISPGSLMGSIVIIRLVIVLVELGTLFLLKTLLQRYHIPLKNIFWYALNPLVIIELSGNLHFEGIMIFFLLLSFILMMQRNRNLAGVAMGFAVGVKLLPLIILPLFLRRLGWKGFLSFGTITTVTVLILFAPLLSGNLLDGMGSSLSLYFQKFEFNASIYYLFREWGFMKTGWNTIATLGPRLAMATVVLVIAYTWYEARQKVLLFDAVLWVMLIYFSMSTTVHPWYITSLVAIGALTGRRWPMVWSFLIFLSYMGYSQTGYSENYVLIFLEYSVLAAWIIFEARQLKRNKFVNRV